MQKRSEELEILDYDSYRNIRKIKEGEVLISPITNLLFNDDIVPLNNSKSWPNWWKSMHSNEGSLRRCAGVGDYLSQGFTIKMWADTTFRPSLNRSEWQGRFEIEGNHPFMIQGFSYHQTGECPVTKVRKIEKANYIKMINPWLFKTAPGWSCLFLPPSWEPNENYTLLPSMVNTDYYHHANIVLNVLTDKEFTIREGTPLQHVIPIPRTKSLEMFFASENTYKHMDQKGFGSTFMPINQKGKYKRAQREADISLESVNNSFLDKIRNLFRK